MKFFLMKSGNGVDGRVHGLTKSVRDLLGWEHKDELVASYVRSEEGVVSLVVRKK